MWWIDSFRNWGGVDKSDSERTTECNLREIAVFTLESPGMLRSSDLRGRRKSGAKNSSRGPISLGVFRFECREGGEDAERGVVIGRRSQDATEDDEEEGKGVRWGRARGFAGGMPMMRLMLCMCIPYDTILEQNEWYNLPNLNCTFCYRSVLQLYCNCVPYKSCSTFVLNLYGSLGGLWNTPIEYNIEQAVLPSRIAKSRTAIPNCIAPRCTKRPLWMSKWKIP
eukprot:429425-Rhodomonas_salina.1